MQYCFYNDVIAKRKNKYEILELQPKEIVKDITLYWYKNQNITYIYNLPPLDLNLRHRRSTRRYSFKTTKITKTILIHK